MFTVDNARNAVGISAWDQQGCAFSFIFGHTLGLFFGRYTQTLEVETSTLSKFLLNSKLTFIKHLYNHV